MVRAGVSVTMNCTFMLWGYRYIFCIVLYCIQPLYCIVLYCIAFSHCIVLYCIAFSHCIVLYCIQPLYCIALYCIAYVSHLDSSTNIMLFYVLQCKLEACVRWLLARAYHSEELPPPYRTPFTENTQVRNIML